MAEEKQIEKLDLITLLGDWFKIARRHILLCLVLICLGGLFFGYRAQRNYAPRYTASASFSVRVANPLYGGTISYNTATAEQMAKTFPYVLTSGVLQERVKLQLGIGYMPIVNVTTSPGGNIITIEVTDGDPQLANQVLRAVMEHYPQIAEYVVGPTKLVLLHESGVPTQPSNPVSWKREAAKGCIMGLALWVGLVLLRAMLVTAIHDEKELKKLVNIPCIGQIPHIRRSAKRGGSLLYHNIRSTGFGEMMRLLRMRVEKAMNEQNWKVLLISSAIPGEGKTTIATNLALSMAHQGKKVLLVDCDLRNPSVAKLLCMTDAPLLGDYLEGSVLMDRVITPTEYKKMYVVAGGIEKGVSQKALRMNRLAELILAARQQFDLVILDTAPCSLLADASEFASMADCGLMVVRQEYTGREQILDGVQRLGDADLPLIGMVMNHVRGKRGGGYGYGHGYGYGYGYGYGQTKE